MSKVMVEPAQASIIACRRVPAPLSAFVVTIGSLKHGAGTSGAGLAFAEFQFVELAPTVDLNE